METTHGQVQGNSDQAVAEEVAVESAEAGESAPVAAAFKTEIADVKCGRVWLTSKECCRGLFGELTYYDMEEGTTVGRRARGVNEYVALAMAFGCKPVSEDESPSPARADVVCIRVDGGGWLRLESQSAIFSAAYMVMERGYPHPERPMAILIGPSSPGGPVMVRAGTLPPAPAA